LHFFFFLLLGRSSATAHHLSLSVQIVNDALGFSGPILLNYLIKFFQSGTQFFLNYVEEWLEKKRNSQVCAWCIFINCPQNDAMILAGNVGSQGGIQNGYMYAILFGAVSAVRSSLLKPTLFLLATKGNIVKKRHCVMSECWMLQSWMSDVICWNSEPMIDKL
jgi:hypothetical protein